MKNNLFLLIFILKINLLKMILIPGGINFYFININVFLYLNNLYLEKITILQYIIFGFCKIFSIIIKFLVIANISIFIKKIYR